MSSFGDEQSEIIAFLSEGRNYGVPGAPVRRIETHWSVIFLVADRAYKLKRRLAFLLLDYTTVEKRERACRAELEVNMGTAPDLYLGMRKICRLADGALAFDADRPAVEWVVVMRRFAQDDLLDHLADTRRLDTSLLRELAGEVVKLHARAEVTAGWGGAATIRDAVERWRSEQRAVADVFEERQSDAYYKAVGLAVSGAKELLELRRKDGKVRRCHGDLRLANICLLDGRVTLFDALEFSAELSCIDVLYDLAFLLVDLHHRGPRNLENIVFNRYFDALGDDDGLRILPLFLSFRAALLGQMLASTAMRRSGPTVALLATAARSHLALALRLLRQRSPHLIAIGGLGSESKSELSAGLAASIGPTPGARLFRGDIERKRLMNVAPEMRLSAAAYDESVTRSVYDALCRKANAALAADTNVVIDMDFFGAEERRKITDVALAAAVPFVGFWFGEPEGRPASIAEPAAKDATGRHRTAIQKSPEPINSTPEWLWIDAAGGVAAALAAARSLMESM